MTSQQYPKICQDFQSVLASCLRTNPESNPQGFLEMSKTENLKSAQVIIQGFIEASEGYAGLMNRGHWVGDEEAKLIQSEVNIWKLISTIIGAEM